MNLPEPDIGYVLQRLEAMRGDDRFYGAERAVQLVFEQWPTNRDAEEVLVKVVVLNRLYSTNIYDPYTVAAHIIALNIDQRLAAGESQLVSDLARVSFRDKKRFLLSFATKYCSWHQPSRFQIFDSYVEWLLWQYKKQFGFATFRKYELRVYPTFIDIIGRFVDHFGLQALSQKDIDKFLWSEGVERWT